MGSYVPGFKVGSVGVFPVLEGRVYVKVLD